MKANEYGVPQRRLRVIFVGIRKDLNKHYVFPSPTHLTTDKRLTLGEIMNIPQSTPNQNEVLEFSPQPKKVIPYIKEGGSWKDVPYEVLPPRLKHIKDNMKKYRAPNNKKRYSRHELNGTTTAAVTRHKSVIIAPEENRRCSVWEIARIQSISDDFVFKGEYLSAKYKMIGNAVPPKLGEVIGESVNQLLSEPISDSIDDSSTKIAPNGDIVLNI